MIRKVKYKEQEFSYPVFDFLYPYLIQYAWRNDLKVNDSVLVVPDDKVTELKLELKKLIIKFLEDFYVEPDHKKRSKYPSRYRKIEINNNKFSVDITSNPKDRVVYQVWTLLNWLIEESQPA